jgi:hypothetical protein
MAETRTILKDPESHNTQRSVFTIPAGLKINSKKIRLCNFDISNTNGDNIYFNHNGVYSLLQKVSLTSLKGTQIDRVQNVDIMGIRLTHTQNATQFSVNRQLSQQMCDSVFVNGMGQTDITEEYQKDDASLMSVYIDVSFMLQYLQQRSVIDEGCTLVFEWADPSVCGFNYSFTIPPCLAVDEFLGNVPSDPEVEHTFLTIIQDKLIVPPSQNSFEKRLNAFYDEYIHNVYYYNIQDKASNPLINPMAQLGEQLEITIDGRKLIPLKGINNDAKKLALLHDFSGEVSIPAYDSAISLNNNSYSGFHNPNLGVSYGGNWSYGCFALDRTINMDFTIAYNITNIVPNISSGYCLMILAEVLRTYNRETDKVGYKTTNMVPA